MPELFWSCARPFVRDGNFRMLDPGELFEDIEELLLHLLLLFILHWEAVCRINDLVGSLSNS